MTDRSRRERGRAPLVVAVVVCLLPAIGFAGLWQWASGVAAEPVETVPPTFEPDGPPRPELTTELASLRRVPGPVADRLVAEAVQRAEEAFRDEVERVTAAAASRGESSCASVALDGEMLAAAGDDELVIPASNQKLFVAVAALEVVGADTTLTTEIRSSPPVDGVVAGDLYLIGSGDPLLRSADLPIERELAIVDPTSFDALVGAVVDAGVTRVEGDVVADGSRYDDEFLVPSWGPDITRADGGPIGGLLVNDGRIFGSGVGLNPAQAAANELSRLLGTRGVTVGGGNRTVAADDDPDELSVLAEISSAPVGDLVAEMLVSSDNQIAEMLLKEIGHVGAGDGSRPGGMAVVRQMLTERGVDLTGAALEDGSGLSRANAVRCATVVGLLGTEPVDGPLGARLPVAGESGTLTDVGVGTPAEGVLRAKTGTLTGVKALSGYLPSGDGPVFELAVLLEGDGVDDPAVHLPVWRELFEVLATFPPEPDPIDVDRLGPR